MSECIVCGTLLVGKQRMFCSNRCRCQTSNAKHQAYAAQQERAIRRKVKLVLMNGGQCSSCGYKKNHAALNFHHLNSQDKLFELDSRSLSNHSWKAIIKEAAKCILLCSNCHQEIHHPELTVNVDQISIDRIEKNLPLANFCCDCGCLRSTDDSERCPACQHRKQERISWPPTEELLKLLESNSYLAVGRMLGVSDNSVRKRIKNHST